MKTNYDLYYYAQHYAGDTGMVSTHFEKHILSTVKARKESEDKKHPFYMVSRPLEDYDGSPYREFKVYDNSNRGLIFKFKAYKGIRYGKDKIEYYKSTHEEFWDKKAAISPEILDYVSYLIDSGTY